MLYSESDLHAKCPTCETDCGVLESHLQATRQEPMRSLGYQGFCPDCQMAFKVDSAQMSIPLVYADGSLGVVKATV